MSFSVNDLHITESEPRKQEGRDGTVPSHVGRDPSLYFSLLQGFFFESSRQQERRATS